MAIRFVYLLTFLATVSAAPKSPHFKTVDLGSCPKYDPHIGFSYKKVIKYFYIYIYNWTKLENFSYF